METVILLSTIVFGSILGLSALGVTFLGLQIVEATGDIIGRPDPNDPGAGGISPVVAGIVVGTLGGALLLGTLGRRARK